MKCQKCNKDMKKLQYSGYQEACCNCIFPGYKYINDWEELINGQKVWLYGFKDNKPHLYGPHKVHNADAHELININQKRSFYNNKDVMAILNFDEDPFDEDFHYNVPLVELDFIEFNMTWGYFEIHLINNEIRKFRGTKSIDYNPPYLTIR